jgi:hypothetical protein
MPEGARAELPGVAGAALLVVVVPVVPVPPPPPQATTNVRPASAATRHLFNFSSPFLDYAADLPKLTVVVQTQLERGPTATTTDTEKSAFDFACVEEIFSLNAFLDIGFP